MIFCKSFFRTNGLVLTPKSEPVYTVSNSWLADRNDANLKINKDISPVNATVFLLGAGIAIKDHRGLTL